MMDYTFKRSKSVTQKNEQTAVKPSIYLRRLHPLEVSQLRHRLYNNQGFAKLQTSSAATKSLVTAMAEGNGQTSDDLQLSRFDLIDFISEINSVHRPFENIEYNSQGFVKEVSEHDQLERS